MAEGQIVEITDSGFVQELRTVRLQIQAELKNILDEFKDMEDEVRKGGIKELGNAQKSYFNMLIELKKQRINTINAMSNNAKSAAEIQIAFNNLQKEIDKLKEAMRNGESGKTITRPEGNPYSTSKRR